MHSLIEELRYTGRELCNSALVHRDGHSHDGTLFAVTMIALGILGLIEDDFAPMGADIQECSALAYHCAFISLVSGKACFGGAQPALLPERCSLISCFGCCF